MTTVLLRLLPHTEILGDDRRRLHRNFHLFLFISFTYLSMDGWLRLLWLSGSPLYIFVMWLIICGIGLW